MFNNYTYYFRSNHKELPPSGPKTYPVKIKGRTTLNIEANSKEEAKDKAYSQNKHIVAEKSDYIV